MQSIGIRTPWTLSSDTVFWGETHQLGGYTLVVGGIMFMAGILLAPPLNLYIPLTGVIIAGLIPVVYSYFLYTK